MLDEIVQLYSDSSLPKKQVKVEFIGEPGDDFGGLTKDLFTSL
jgi:glutamate synthase domain-containing protein 3